MFNVLELIITTMVRTVTTGATVTTRTTTHDLSLHGRAGAILILILVCFVTFLIAFTTAGWSKGFGLTVGLWQTCRSFTTGKLALAVVVVNVANVYIYAAQLVNSLLILGKVEQTNVTSHQQLWLNIRLILGVVIVYWQGDYPF